MNKPEIVKTKFDLNRGNYIPEVFFECEKGGSVIFKHKEGKKIVYIPKSVIKKGFKRDKQKLQDVVLADYCHKPFYWKYIKF